MSTQRNVKPYPAEFREKVVQLAQVSGRRPREIAEEFGISADSVRRCTRSGATSAREAARAVQRRRRRLTPCRPSARISRATPGSDTCSPCAYSSACTRGAPYVPCDSAWMRAIRSLIRSFSRARRLGGRFSHA